MLVGPEEGICPGRASVLTTIFPRARRHPSQIWTKETCLSHWQVGDHAVWRLLPGSVRVWSRRGRVVSLHCLTGTWLLVRPFPWTSDRGHAILPWKTALIDLELDRLGIQLASLSETWWYSSGSIREEHYTIFWNGFENGEKPKQGVGKAICNTLLSCVEQPLLVSPRLYLSQQRRNHSHYLSQQEETISQKQKQVRNVVLHYKETGNYAKQCRCTVTTNSNHKASKNKQDLQLCVKILVTPD